MLNYFILILTEINLERNQSISMDDQNLFKQWIINIPAWILSYWVFEF